MIPSADSLEDGDSPVYLSWHKDGKHAIKKQKPGEVNGWDCDARAHFGKCFSGLTGFYQSKGVEGYSCRPCNFDICKKCLQVELFIQMIQNRED